MIILSVTLYFFIPISSATIDLVKFIEHNIDETVDPCDNFYRHICAKDKPANETVRSLLRQKYNEILNDLDLPKNLEFAKNIKATESPSSFFEILTNINQTENIQKIANDYLSNCVNKNMSTMKTILQKLGEEFETVKFENLIFDRNCERAAKSLNKNLQDAWFHFLKETEDTWYSINSTITNIQAHIWYSENHYQVMRHNVMLENFKNELLEQIKNTPWIDSTNTLLSFLSITKQIELKKCIETEEDDLRNVLEANSSFENCRLNSTIESLNILCYLEQSVDYVRNLRKFNAFNEHPKICLHNVLYSAVMNNDSPGVFYGSSGAVMAHEIGHTFVKSLRDHAFLPDFSKMFETCVNDQFEKTCSSFVEKSCTTSSRQFEENGSDIFGSRLAFDVMIEKHGEKMKDVVPGSKYNFTNAEMFFYAANYAFCNRNDSESDESDSHHAQNARVNAAVVQSPYFPWVFKCDSESPMMKSKSNECHLFGRHARE